MVLRQLNSFQLKDGDAFLFREHDNDANAKIFPKQKKLELRL